MPRGKPMSSAERSRRARQRVNESAAAFNAARARETTTVPRRGSTRRSRRGKTYTVRPHRMSVEGARERAQHAADLSRMLGMAPITARVPLSGEEREREHENRIWFRTIGPRGQERTIIEVGESPTGTSEWDINSPTGVYQPTFITGEPSWISPQEMGRRLRRRWGNTLIPLPQAATRSNEGVAPRAPSSRSPFTTLWIRRAQGALEAERRETRAEARRYARAGRALAAATRRALNRMSRRRNR